MAVDTGSFNWNEVLRRAADAYLNGSGANPTILSDILAELVTIESDLSTPATYLPPLPLMNPGDLTGYKIDISTTTATQIATDISAQKVRAYRARIYVAGATNVSIYDGDPAGTGAVVEVIPFPSAGGIVLDFDSRPFWSSQTGKTLWIKQSAAVQMYGRISYTQGA
jgi:hypothetical protein